MLESQPSSDSAHIHPQTVTRGHVGPVTVFDKFDGEAAGGLDLLDLPALRTTSFKKTLDDVLVQTEVTLLPPESCPACGGFLFIRNGAPPHIVKDQPILGRRARLYFKW